MGNSGGRPSCLGEKSPKTEDFLKDTYLKDLGLDSGPPAGRNKVTGRTGPPDKAPLSPGGIENGWWSTVVLGPKQNNMDGMVPNGSLSCNPLHLVPLEANSAAAAAGAAGWSWPWKPHTTAEVTEVTEVTETIVTEIVEVTEYLGGAKRREPIVTRTVTVRTECTEALPEVNSRLLWEEKGKAVFAEWPAFPGCCRHVHLEGSENLLPPAPRAGGGVCTAPAVGRCWEQPVWDER